jgi:hypothetical protein
MPSNYPELTADSLTRLAVKQEYCVLPETASDSRERVWIADLGREIIDLRDQLEMARNEIDSLLSERIVRDEDGLYYLAMQKA